MIPYVLPIYYKYETMFYKQSSTSGVEDGPF